MKVKVPCRDGVWECKVSNKDGTPYKINDSENPDNCEDIFVKNTRVRAIITCVGLWVASGEGNTILTSKYGDNWTIRMSEYKKDSSGNWFQCCDSMNQRLMAGSQKS